MFLKCEITDTVPQEDVLCMRSETEHVKSSFSSRCVTKRSNTHKMQFLVIIHIIPRLLCLI